jgi:hypothetical protein
MSSLYLARQKPEDRYELIKKLHSAQKGHCFICEGPIDLAVHKNSIDIDHVVPLTVGGKVIYRFKRSALLRPMRANNSNKNTPSLRPMSNLWRIVRRYFFIQQKKLETTIY